MAHVQLGHFVIRQVIGFDAAFVHRAQQGRSLMAIGDLDAHENMRDLGVGISIVEFGNAALAKKCTKLAEAARSLGNRYGQNGLALFAQFCPFGNEA